MSKKMQKSDSVKVPKLRFPGFDDLWKNTNLGDIADFFKGQGISKEDVKFDGASNCIRYGELYTDYHEVIKKIKSKTNVSAKDSFLGMEDDVIIPSSGETAIDIATVSCVKQNDVLYGGDINVLRLKDKQSSEFFSYYLSNYKRREIAKYAQGQSVVHLYANQLKKIVVNLPDLSEQRKIADFLGSVDWWIENLKAQKESLEKYKKGMMQKIFSQEIRFKGDDGKDFPDWEEKRLGEVAKFWNGKAHEQNISKNGKFIVVNSKFISQDGEVKKYSDTRISPLQRNDIVIVMSDVPNGKAIGKCFLINEDNRYTLNQRIGGIKSKEVIGSFLIRILNRNKYFLKFDNGVSQTNLRRDEIFRCPIIFPNMEEQQKIADFLSGIDKLIEAKNKKIEDANNWKKGLMQQLFV